MWWPAKSEFFGNVVTWSGDEYWKSSMFALRPQRIIVIWWITARGCTPSRSVMNVPVGSLNGPNESGAAQPITRWNHATASAMFGTVMPTWSIPTSWSDGVPLAVRAGAADGPSAEATTKATAQAIATRTTAIRLRGLMGAPFARGAASGAADMTRAFGATLSPRPGAVNVA